MNNRKKVVSCLLAGAILIGGTGIGTNAAQAGGVTSVIATGITSNGSPAAGFSKMLSQCLIDTDKAAEEAAAQQAAEEQQTYAENAQTQEAVVQDTAAPAMQYYIVQQGDTLRSISYQVYGTYDMVSAICAWNGIEDADSILYGQRLLLQTE